MARYPKDPNSNDLLDLVIGIIALVLFARIAFDIEVMRSGLYLTIDKILEIIYADFSSRS